MERIGVGFEAGLRPKEIMECVRDAEELGYESAWVTEGHAGDQFSILTACALATDHILLGTAISSIFVRGAPTIAMAAACVDEYSDGRFILGLGSSHKSQVEGEYGVPYDRPIPRLLEYIDIIRGLLRDGRVSHAGPIYAIEDFEMWFRPLRGDVPIYLGAVNPKMLDICGEIAQGVILVQATVEQIRAAAEHVAAGAERVGRDPADVEVALLMPCSISDDREEARDRVRPRLAMYAARFPRYRRVIAEGGFADEAEAVYQAWLAGDTAGAQRLLSDELIDNWTLVGTPQECRDRIQAYRDAGVTLPIVSPVMNGENAKRQAMDVIRSCVPE